MSFEKRKAIKKIVEDLEQANLVEPTHSYWAAPSILVKKKDGTFRLVVDYRGLNKQIEKTSWPLPRINDIIDSLDGNIYFSNIDLTSGYFQMALEEESQHLTDFITSMGLYKWKRLPMGLDSAPGAFQNLMELILAGLSYEVAMIYLDDIIIFGKSFQEHLSRLELVLSRIKEAGLKIKGSKCRFFRKRTHFLGHIISKDGVDVDPDKVSAAANMKPPSNLKELRATLGLVGFYRRFIADFGKTAEPLYRLLSKTEKFVWTTECGESMNQLKLKLQEAPILGFPNDTEPYTLTTDASLTGIGAIITQKQSWGDRVIAYASKTVNKGQRNYSATKRELYAIVYFTHYFRKYLLGRKFTIVTDHRALTWLYSFKEPEGMLARWIEKLGQFKFEIPHQAGKNIPHADCLSRVPVVEDPSLVEEKTQILIEQPTENSWSDVFGDQTDDLRQHQQNSREIKEVF